MKKIIDKVGNNIRIYKNDIDTKGLYWSIMHRLYKIPFSREVLKPIVNTIKPNYVIAGGHKIYIDKLDETISQELLLSRQWEEFESEIFAKNIRPGDVVIDIGAHIGWYTLLAAKLVGPKGKVYAFEPDTTNFNLLEKNIIANGYKNVQSVKMAVTNTAGRAKLFLNNENTGDHHIFATEEIRESITIQTTTLDKYFTRANKTIGLIKMDIQGSEMNALIGAKNILKKNNNLKIITEFQPASILQSGHKPTEFLALLRKYGFKIYQIDEFHKVLKFIKSDINLLEMYPETDSSETNFTNLLCVKS